MAVSWGAWSAGGGIRSRLGVEWTRTGSTSGTLHADIHIQVDGWVSDSFNTLSIGGSFSYSGTKSIVFSGPGTALLQRVSRSWAAATGSNTTYTVTASLSGFTGGSPSLSSSHTVGPLPANRPAAPSGLSVSRVSDTQHALSWTNNPTSAAPYTVVKLERWDARTNEWAQVMNGGGSRSSWTDTTTSPNNAYRWRIRAQNNTGHSPYSNTTGLVSTTPGQPTQVSASRSTDDITIRWVNGARPGAFTGSQIEGTTDNGATWERLSSATGPVATSFIHVSPSGSSSWRYRVRAYAGSLFGPWSPTSNTVTIIGPPLAPANLTPGLSELVDVNSPIVLAWQHNPVDASAQSAYELEWRRLYPTTTEWTRTGVVESTDQQVVIPAETWSRNSEYEWQVRTWGRHPDPSPWAFGWMNTEEGPSALITSPVDGEPYSTSDLTVEWNFHSPASPIQSGYRVSVTDQDGTPLAQTSGTGAAKSWEYPGRLDDGQQVTVTVQVRDRNGLWSDPATSTVDVVYPRPPVPFLSGEWDVDTGTVSIAVTNPGWDGDAGEVEPVEFELWATSDPTTVRLHQDWLTTTGDEDAWAALVTSWRATATLVATVGLDEAITDHAPPTGVTVLYQVVSRSALPSSAASSLLAVSTAEHDSRIWLNHGPGWGDRLWVRHDADVDIGHARERVMQKFLGRKRRTEFLGEGVTETVGVDVRIPCDDDAYDGATFADLTRFMDLPAPILYRDPMGRRWEVAGGSATLRHKGVIQRATISMERVGDDETPGGALPPAPWLGPSGLFPPFTPGLDTYPISTEVAA